MSTRAGSLLLDRRSAAVGLAVPGTDFHAVVNRRIAVTPIHLDLTGRSLLKRLRTWDWEIVPAGVPAGPDPATSGDTATQATEAGEARITEEAQGDRR